MLLVIVLTAVTLITLDTRNGRSGPLGALGRGAHTIVGPLQRAVDDATRPVGDWWSGVTDSGDIKRDNRGLRQQVAALEGKDRAAQQAIDENESLKKLLGLNSVYDVPRVNARIVGRDPGNFSSTLTIDHGTDSGIAIGMPVIAPDGSLVGRVQDAGAGFSTIRVLTDPEFAVGVLSPAHPPSNATTGTAQGQVASHDLLVDDFDAQAKILVGDRIVTSPLSTRDPPDLPVGTVTRVVDLPGGFSRDVYVRPYVDLGALDYVSVMRWAQGQGPVVRVTTTTTTTTTTPTTSTTTTTTTPGGN